MNLLFNKSHYSFLSAYSKPSEIPQACAENGFAACGITDWKSVSAANQFIKSAQKHQIKPVIGVDISADGNVMYCFCLNMQGWKNVLKILYSGLQPEYSEDLVFVTNNKDLLPYVSRDRMFNIQEVAFHESRYIKEEDYRYANIICQIGKVQGNILNHRIYPASTMIKAFTKEQLANSQKIVDMVEPFSLESKPILPKFQWTEGKTQNEYLRHLCRQGWRQKIAPRLHLINQQEYVDRINRELAVIEGADLAGYFLMVQDYVQWAKQRMLVGPGRGSGGGCLVSYLTNITAIDPIQHSLLFERFYNAGRNTTTKISLPDIDTDFPVEKRKSVIDYLKERYGSLNVAHMATFSTLKGRGALKEIMRHENVPFDEINRLTKLIVEESKVSDQMEDTGHTSVLSWMLEFRPKILQEFVRQELDGTLTGDYADYFRQALKIEGTIKAISQHASGILVTPLRVIEHCPVLDKDDHLLAAMDMGDLESLGLVKVDILGVNCLDKLEMINA